MQASRNLYIGQKEFIPAVCNQLKVLGAHHYEMMMPEYKGNFKEIICYADAMHMLRTCYAYAHLDGGLVGGEYRYAATQREGGVTTTAG